MTIRNAINEVKKHKRAAFIPYFILGYPDLETSYQLIKEASRYSDVIELGIPFSDPIADGPTIQKGVTHALNQNISLQDIFDISKRLSSEIETPLIYMMYFNQIFSFGMKDFLKKLSEIGIKGLIVPDLLPDSEPEFNQLAKEYAIELIFLLTPTTPKKRIPIILKECQGFLYFVAVIGITGERKHISEAIEPVISSIKSETDIPICVGFGISTPEQVLSVSNYADGTIVGSAIVKKITENLNSSQLIPNVISIIKEMSSALSKEKN